MGKTIIILLFTVFLNTSLHSDSSDNLTSIKQPEKSVVRYLHLSHTRTDFNYLFDNTVRHLNYLYYDMLWLGGDLAVATSIDDKTMYYIDRIFRLSSYNTLWSLGNHDYDNLWRIQNFTGRPSFYCCYKNGITFIVLDTQDSLSNIIGSQKQMFNQVTDTIEKSSHLIVLHHKLIWMYNHPLLEPLIPFVSNAPLGDYFYCINPNNFYTDIYPKLIQVKNKGIKVLCIAGDIGKFCHEFQYETDEGIYFLASGINSGEEGNKALVFIHNQRTNTLTWHFKPLSEVGKEFEQ